MPRKSRKKGETGIYHVIVRGIAEQDILTKKMIFRDTWKGLDVNTEEPSPCVFPEYRKAYLLYFQGIVNFIFTKEGQALETDIIMRMATKEDAEEILEIYAPYVTDTAISFEFNVPSVKEFAYRINNIAVALHKGFYSKVKLCNRRKSTKNRLNSRYSCLFLSKP